MTTPYAKAWRPTRFRYFLKKIEGTSTGPAQIMTDAGKAFIKPLGNKEGPHVLAKEWIGTCLAKWFELPTLEFAIMQVEEVDEIPLGHNKMAEPGPAFITRAVEGAPWSGGEKQLKKIVNQKDIMRLVVFDTWILNPDRCPPKGDRRKPNPDNILFVPAKGHKGKYQMVVFDHTHCLGGGKELSRRLNAIECVQDERIYGLFPTFIKYVQIQSDERDRAVTKLKTFERTVIQRIVDAIPESWEVPSAARKAVCNLVEKRAGFLAENLKEMLRVPGGIQESLGTTGGES
jgi:hypothetical protein